MTRGWLLMTHLMILSGGLVGLGHVIDVGDQRGVAPTCDVKQVSWPTPNTGYRPLFLRPERA
jgi:hypothetical protein